MDFRILATTHDKLEEGQRIHYKIKLSRWFSVYWLTEIEKVVKPFEFTDVQLEGPYRLWRHRHQFKPVEGGIEMTDEVAYSLPYGIIGRLAHFLFVRREVNAIFDHRSETLAHYFVQSETVSAV